MIFIEKTLGIFWGILVTGQSKNDVDTNFYYFFWQIDKSFGSDEVSIQIYYLHFIQPGTDNQGHHRTLKLNKNCKNLYKIT